MVFLYASYKIGAIKETIQSQLHLKKFKYFRANRTKEVKDYIKAISLLYEIKEDARK